jgi:DNA processing protein
MNWDKKVLKNQNQQTSLFLDLNKEEQLVFGVVYKNDRISLDRIISEMNLSRAELLQVLLQLELKGLIESLPGMIYIKS